MSSPIQPAFSATRGGPAQQDGTADAGLGQLGGRADHILVVALGEYDACRIAAGLRPDPGHDRAARAQQGLQAVEILVQVEFLARHARAHGRVRDGGRTWKSTRWSKGLGIR